MRDVAMAVGFGVLCGCAVTGAVVIVMVALQAARGFCA